MGKFKLTDNQFKAILYHHDMIDEQIKLLQDGKKRLIESYGITMTAFYIRRKNMTEKEEYLQNITENEQQITE